MARTKQTDEEALAELRKWCKPLELEVEISDYYVAVLWINPVNGEKSPVVSMQRPTIRAGSVCYPFMRKRVSVSATCGKIIEQHFKSERWLYWERSKTTETSPYIVMHKDTIGLKLPKAESAEEFEIKLGALGWTGNPFGPSMNFKEKT